MAASFTDDLEELITTAAPAMVELRHEFHRHPELAFHEITTTRRVRDRLTELGWRLDACPTETGAVATLDTGRPGRTVMIRADIDALPVGEEREFSFRSTVDGLMHACGHDVHTAALLGVADVLARRRDDLTGTYVALFQPAEEAIGGARAMIDGGVLEGRHIDRVIGVHVTANAPLGIVACKPGVMMSEADSFTVTLRGAGGHGAMATSAGNVVLAVAALAARVGSVVDGLELEGTTGACSAGMLSAGTAPNVVPRVATLRGTLRTFTDAHRTEALARLAALLDDLQREFDVTPEFALNDRARAVVNNPDVTAVAMASAKGAPGVDAVLKIGPVTPSDDVSEFLNRIPGCYLFVGGALEDGSSGQHHSATFAIDDRATAVIAGVLAKTAVELAQA
jgi:amidohydrolase